VGLRDHGADFLNLTQRAGDLRDEQVRRETEMSLLKNQLAQKDAQVAELSVSARL
jgi:hypothetical protein